MAVSSPPPQVGPRPKSSDSNRSRSRWPLTFSRSASNNSIISSPYPIGASGSSGSGDNTTARANSGKITWSQRAQKPLSRAVKNIAVERPGSASTIDSFATALPSPSLSRSDLPSPRSSLHHTNNERRKENVSASGQNLTSSKGPLGLIMKEDDENEDAESGASSTFKAPDDSFISIRRGLERPYKSPDRKELSTGDLWSLSGYNETKTSSRDARLPFHPLSKPGGSELNFMGKDASKRGSLTRSNLPDEAGASTPSATKSQQSPPTTPSASDTHSNSSPVISNWNAKLAATALFERALSKSPSATVRDLDIDHSKIFTISSDPIAYNDLTSGTRKMDRNFVSPEKNGNGLRQKLNKTGGIFRRMGNTTISSKNSTLVKRSSQSSLGSESGASIAYSTKSAPGTFQARWHDSAAEPLPHLPDKYKDNITLNISRGESSSTTQSENSTTNRQGLHMSPSSADGSTGSSTTEMRHTLQAWKREMDSTLEQTGQNLEEKTKITTPTTNRTLTPQLPECRLLSRPRSFMDDEDDEGGQAIAYAEQGETLRSTDTVTSHKHFLKDDSQEGSHYDKHYLSSAMSDTRRATSLGMTSNSSFDQDADNASALRAPLRAVSSDETGRFRKLRGRNEDVSYASVASYETAKERPSLLLNHQEEIVESRHEKQSTITQLNHESDALITSMSIMVDSHDEGMSENASAQRLALQCWNEDESHRGKNRIAEWLGKNEPLHEASRRFYMSYFDFTNLRIDVAFRKLCDKLYLRAETQQIDRILSAFGQRYFDCNPQSKRLLLNADVVHALVFSILLLNTDLHVAEMHDRMTRIQFVRNTLAAIQECNESLVTSLPRASNDLQEWMSGGEGGGNNQHDSAKHDSLSQMGPVANLPMRKDSLDTMPFGSRDGFEMKSPAKSVSLDKAWESEMENLLKEIYIAVKSNQIRLPLIANDGSSASSISKTFKFGTDRVNALKRGSIRGLQGLLGSNHPHTSVRVDESPSLSRVSLNSTHQSQTDSFTGISTPSTSLLSASSYALPPTLGFANTLSQSIINESKDEDDDASLRSAHDDLTDDELALMGPPWAKEGNLIRKLYWEAPQRRAKDKSWTNCFVVVQKGTLSMFKFGEDGNNSTIPNGSAAFGGGNWLSNAICIGEIGLAHTLANALPPPGYNKERPHVFALTLPSGRVYFFQAGHEDLLQEWVSTCNYWAARQSKEPLAGGVSNVEYGWNNVLPDEASQGEVQQDEENTSIRLHLEPSRPSFSNMTCDTRSIRSGKSAKSLRARATNGGLFRSQTASTMASLTSPFSAASIPMRESNTFTLSDRPLYINEWREPAPPTVSSTLNEEDQLEACKRYKDRVEMELMQHNSLKKPMMDYLQNLNQGSGGMGGATNKISTTTMNKALANFNRKANYLLSDLTKFTLYTAILTSANKLKAEKRDARSINRMMLKADEESSKIKVEEEGPPIRMS